MSIGTASKKKDESDKSQEHIKRRQEARSKIEDMKMMKELGL